MTILGSGLLTVVAFLFLLSGTVQGPRDIQDLRVGGLTETYDLASWRDKARKENYTRLVSIAEDVDISTIPKARLLSQRQFEAGYGGLPTLWYLLSPHGQGEEGEAYIHVRMSEGSSIEDAHKAMLAFFARCDAIQPFPKGESAGLQIGDVCFLGWGKEIAAVTFVRNNVFMDVFQEGNPPYRTVDIARSLDERIREVSFGPPSDYPLMFNVDFGRLVTGVLGNESRLQEVQRVRSARQPALPEESGKVLREFAGVVTDSAGEACLFVDSLECASYTAARQVLDSRLQAWPGGAPRLGVLPEFERPGDAFYWEVSEEAPRQFTILLLANNVLVEIRSPGLPSMKLDAVKFTGKLDDFLQEQGEDTLPAEGKESVRSLSLDVEHTVLVGTPSKDTEDIVSGISYELQIEGTPRAFAEFEIRIWAEQAIVRRDESGRFSIQFIRRGRHTVLCRILNEKGECVAQGVSEFVVQEQAG